MRFQRRIRIVVILGTICLFGLIITQLYWIDRSLDTSERKLDQNIHSSLLNVSKRMAKVSQNGSPNPNPVVQLSDDYFVVNINDEIDASILEHFLLQEFRSAGIDMDFEYGIYDCESNKMLYGKKISANNEGVEEELPLYDEYIYYFGLRFPNKTAYVLGDSKGWMFSSIILLVVILFFSTTLVIILKQRRLSEIQKDFINNMTHEFKTPISTIKVSSEVLSDDSINEDPERLKRYVEIIKSENERLLQQVNTVLQNASLEGEKEQLDILEFDPTTIITESASKVNSKYQTQVVSIELHSHSTIKGDPLHFSNLIHNLVDNAIKYCQTEPEIRIKTWEDDKQFFLSIQDNGVGIAKDKQKLIFQKFYRINQGDVHDVKGFGLGLNYVASVVRLHNWKILVDSQEGKGSVFKLIIPK